MKRKWWRPSFGRRVFLSSASVVVLAALFSLALLFFINPSRVTAPVITIGAIDRALHENAPEFGRSWSRRSAWRAMAADIKRRYKLAPICISVIDVDGGILYREGHLLDEYARDGRVPQWDLVALLAGKSHRNERDWVYAVAPVARNGRAVGVIIGDLRDYSSYLSDRVTTQTIRIYSALISVFATILASALASVYLVHGLRSRLRRLTEAIRAMAAGDYRSRLAEGPADEIGGVAAAFNLLADRLAEARAKEEELDRLKRDLIANVSHDLRGPLTSIQGYLEAIEDGLAGDPETVQKYVGTIRQKSEQLARLVDDLLLYARLESGSYPLNKEPVILADWLRESLAKVEPDLALAGLELAAEIPAADVSANLDARRMDQVVANLAQNAVRYAPRGSTIPVDLVIEGGQAVITFRNQGPSLDPRDLPHVFERFYQGRDKSQGVGAGLGLAIAAQLVEAHGGRIRAWTPPEGGVAFSFTLPLAE